MAPVMTSRNAQIAEMLAAFPSISVIVADELYSLPLTKPDCSLLIDLPPDFPATEAILLVEPVREHEWILPSGQVKVPNKPGRTVAGLLKEIQWELDGAGGGRKTSIGPGYYSATNYSNDSLQMVSNNAISNNAMSNNAMSNNSMSNNSMSNNAMSNNAMSNNTMSNTAMSNNLNHQHTYTSPITAPITAPTPQYQSTSAQSTPIIHSNQQTSNQATVPTSPVHRQLLDDDCFLIDQLDGDQIQALLADEGALEAFLSTLDTFRALDSEAIQAENFKIAEQNLREKVTMDGLVKELQAVQEKYSTSLQHYQLTLQQNSESLKKLDLKELKEQLRVELKEADRSSQLFLKEALNSGAIESQIKDYIRQRKEFHYKSILLRKLE